MFGGAWSMARYREKKGELNMVENGAWNANPKSGVMIPFVCITDNSADTT